ncbi:uncharacterized protein LOC132609179 [Lycium barbarum]|uniref:uncharacterized protein LOC132609179 n=1 Tax=Lycium barbarum TaxID=112863 RepID=UPI00293E92A9|nr:uncharacterized protein LOC132609179 [Lycium barbarum]
MENGELNCEPSDLRISYMINALSTRRKTHPSFIMNDRQVVLYMLDVAVDGSRPVLRINVVERSQVGSTSAAPPPPTKPPLPQPPADEASMEHEGMGDHFMDMDDPNSDDEECDGNYGGDGQPPKGSQRNHNFGDGTGFYCGQTFENKEYLKVLLNKVAIKTLFCFKPNKSNNKYYKVECTSADCGWMLRANKYDNSDRFHIYKYIGDHTCGVEHVTSTHKHASAAVLASVLMNDYIDNKGPTTKEIQRTVFREFHFKPSYWQCWKAGVTAKNMVRGTLEHGYACLPAYSYMVENLNPGSRICISLDDADRFKYYFVAYGACIRGYKHMRKVITVDGTHLYDKYEGVLFSAAAQDTENYIYPIAFCVADKECYESWTYFFEQLRYIIADEPDMCIISNRHKSIANSVFRIFKHAHHGLCMKHLGDNLRKNFQCGDSLHVYYDAAKAYGYHKFNEHFQQLRKKCPEAANCPECDIRFDKWCRAYFPANRYDVLTTNIAESLNSMLRDKREYPVTTLFTSISRRFSKIFRQRRAYISSSINLFVPSAEKTLREKMSEGDSLFVNNINGDADEFTVVGSGLTAKVNLLNKTCTCREYDMVKLPCAHAMAALRLKYGPDYDSSIYEYSSPIYKVQSYILAFGETINVVPAE